VKNFSPASKTHSPQEDKSDKKPSFSVAVILGILFLFIGLWRLEDIPPGLYVDEGVYGLLALDIIEGKDSGAYFNRVWGVDALYAYLGGVSFKVKKLMTPTDSSDGGQSLVVPLRAVSVFGGVFTVVGVYLVGTLLFGKKSGLLGAFFVCFSRWLINFSRISFQGVLLPAVSVFSVYFFLQGIYSSSGRRKTTYMVLAGIFSGLGFYTYIPSRLVPFVFLFFILWKIFSDKNFFNPENRRHIIFFVASAAAVSVPLVVHFARFPEFFISRASTVYSGGNFFEIFKNFIKTAGMFFVKGDMNPRHNIPGLPILTPAVSLFFAGGTALAIKDILCLVLSKKEISSRSARLSADAGMLLLLWLAFMLVPSVFSDEAPHALRTIGAIPPVFILSGYFASSLFFDFLPLKKYSLLLAALFVIIAGYDGLHSYFSVWSRLDSVRSAFGYWKTDLARKTLSLSKGDYDVILPPGFWADPSVNFIARSEYKNRCGVAASIDSFSRQYNLLTMNPDGKSGRHKNNVIYMLSYLSESDKFVSSLFKEIYPVARRITDIRDAGGGVLYEYMVISSVSLKDIRDLKSYGDDAAVRSAFYNIRFLCENTPWLKDQMRYLPKAGL